MATKKDIYSFIEDVVVETNDVSKELASVAKEYNIKTSQLDFDIQKVRTFQINKETGGEFTELDGGLLKGLDKDNLFAKPNMELKQLYTIRIFPKDDYDDPFRDAVTHLTANDDFTSVAFVIEKGSEIYYRDTILKDTINYINKKKVLNFIFINIREGNLKTELEKFIVKKIAILQENEIFKVSSGVKAVQQIDDKLELLYKNKYEDSSKNKHNKIDHSQRGFIIAVNKDETIIRYTKPQKGIEGRDCRGRSLRVLLPKMSNVPDFIISNNIRKIDSEKSFDYIALIDGQVTFKERTYDIEAHVQTGALSFKGTGSINAGMDRNMEIDVKEGDSAKDALGMGVKVTVSNLNVDGNVGENTEIKAHQVKVNGQTHKTSKIIADDISIEIHKGLAIGDKIDIRRLEAGVIEGEMINIKDAVGGIIRGRDITIENLYSYVKIYSSKKISINNIHGSENLIVIDLEGYKEGSNEIDETKKLVEESGQRIEYLQRILKEELEEVLEVRKAFTFTNKRIKEFEKYNVEPPKSILAIIEQYQSFLESYKEMKEELSIQKEKHDLYEKKFKELEKAIFDAEIRVKDSWKGYSKIEFRLLNPKRTLEKIMQQDMRDSSFRLAQVMYEDNQFEIVTKSLDEVGSD